MWSDSATVREWQTAESPTQKTLYQVVQTARGPFAVGSSGVIVTRRDGEWLTVVEHGPATRDNALRGIDVTDDGKRVWYLGGSGALGCYDVETDRKYDYSFPQGKTSTWTGIAVAGKAGSEKALAANGSGTVLPFAIDGFDVDWAPATKPGSGSTIAALAAAPDGTGFAVDTSGSAYKTTADDGWEDIGVVNAQVGFNDISAGPNGRVYVAGGTGKLYRYDDSYNAWTPIQVGANALETVAIDDQTVLVAGGGGQIYQRTPSDDVPRWDRLHSPTNKTIRDVALGQTDVGVTSGGGIIVRDGSGTERKNESDGTSPDGDNYEGRGEQYDGSSGSK
ncbi:WD40/YVTN/BNR-like repeat-containing protein [Halarchaeum sp. P4]|uniref:WD40/YVTN/BNR-like repeat-containing protein n=1 Tax=Halarchaeum sp. P4 TaxID=3421639 RepID=UPI003EBF24CC